MRCGKSWEQHINIIDKVRKKLMGLFMMEKNLVTKYFETFQVLDGSFSVHLTIDMKSMHLTLTFCDHNWKSN